MRISFVVFLVILGLTLGLSAQEQERISMSVGDLKMLETPFNIESYTLTPKGKFISVEVDKSVENRINVTAHEQGECVLQVNGPKISKIYNISVLSNIRKILTKLRSDLQDLTELDISINQDNIVIRGSISSHEKWLFLKKALASYDEKVVRNFATFKPSLDTIISLKKTLTEAGYEFSEKKECEPGQLYMKVTPAALLISGEVMSEGELNEIKEILSTQSWLSFDSNASSSEGKTRCIMNVKVIQSQIAVDVAFIGLTRTDADNLGSTGTLQATFSASRLINLLHGGVENKTATFGGTMEKTLEFLAKNGVTRQHKAGTVTFTNNSPNGGHIKVGGTVFVPVVGKDSGDVKEISYGFDVTVKGSQINKRQFNLNFSVENSQMKSNLHREENIIQTDRICELDKTAVMGGYKSVTEGLSKSGLPILRNTPVLKWFVANDEENKEEVELILLACPRIAKYDPNAEIDISVTEQVSHIVPEEKKTLKEVEEDRKKHKGFWSWLNWFSW